MVVWMLQALYIYSPIMDGCGAYVAVELGVT